MEKSEDLEVKRDMDLIRQLMIEIEGTEDMAQWFSRTYTKEEQYQIIQLAEAGLIRGVIMTECDGGVWIPELVGFPRLTWQGHEFLDAARNDTVWKSVRTQTANAVGTVSFAVLTQLLIVKAKELLGMNP